MQLISLTLFLKCFTYNVLFELKKIIILVIFIVFILVIFYDELLKNRDFIFNSKYVNNFIYNDGIFIYVVNALNTFV